MIKKSEIKHIGNNKIKLIFEEYVRVVNSLIDVIWKQQSPCKVMTVIETITIDTWISKRLKKVAVMQAIFIVDRQRKKGKNCQPILNRILLDIDSEFIDIKNIA